MLNKMIKFFVIAMMLVCVGCHGVIAVGSQSLSLPAAETVLESEAHTDRGKDGIVKKNPGDELFVSVSVDKLRKNSKGYFLSNKKDLKGRRQGGIYIRDDLGNWLEKIYIKNLINSGYNAKPCDMSEINKMNGKVLFIEVINIEQHNHHVNIDIGRYVTTIDANVSLYQDGVRINTVNKKVSGYYQYNTLTAMFNTGFKRQQSVLYTANLVAEKSVLAFEKILSSKDTAYIKFVNTRKSATGQIARIIIEAKNYNAKTENIRIFNNGAEIHAKETETLYNQEIGIVTKSYNINIQRGLNTITAFISDETGNKKSNEANYSIVGDYKLDKNPQLYAVVVGINHFKNNKDLKYAVPDASTFGTALYKHTNDIFSNVKLMYLREKKETTKFAIVKALKQLQNISPNDYFIFYVSSHGGIIDGVFYLACSDGAISHYELLELFKRIPTANKLLLFDTCQSGMINSEVSKKLFEYSQRKMNITSISAAQSHQAALEGYADGHGIFTYVLMDGLEGDADFNRDGIVQSIELVSYAKKHVPVAAARKFNHVQVPASFQAGQVFPVTKHKRNTGQVPLSTQYFKKEEVQKLLSYIEYNNIEKFNEAIEKKRIETENKIVELKIDAEQSEAGILENEFNYSKQNMTIDRIKFIFHDDSVFLGIADKIKDHYTFVDNKGNILLVVDIFSSEFTKHSVNYIDTSKVSKIDIGWHNSFYRVTLHLKKLSEYDLKKTDSGIFIKIRDKY